MPIGTPPFRRGLHQVCQTPVEIIMKHHEYMTLYTRKTNIFADCTFKNVVCTTHTTLNWIRTIIRHDGSNLWHQNYGNLYPSLTNRDLKPGH